MDFINFLHAFILGLVEGLTEFIPVSSTGHLIIASNFLGLNSIQINVFEIFIQLGAILAIVYEYRKIFLKQFFLIPQDRNAQSFFIKLVISFIPAAILGLLFHTQIHAYLFNPISVSIALIIGGFIILIIENLKIKSTILEVKQITFSKALLIGLFQCLSLIPGTSRSGATIMGAMLLKLNRQTATEFSFFMAVPVIIAASCYEILKNHQLLNTDDILFFLTGFIASFISALYIIRFLIRYVSNHNFKVFAYYRIGFGLIFLILFS